MANGELETAILIMSLATNVIIISMVYKFRDLIRFGLMLRKVLSKRKFFDVTPDKLNEKIERLDKAFKQITEPGAPPDPNAPAPIEEWLGNDAKICSCCTQDLPDDVDTCFQCVGYSHFEPKYISD